ncbi:MAG: LytTR family DNA-binding domain-containing protein [Bacteroidota bacterium]
MDSHNCLDVRTNKGDSKCLELDDITYVTSFANGITIHTADGDYTDSASMDDFMDSVAEFKIFCRAHNKYIVNMNYIDSYSKTTYALQLKNSVCISFSKQGLKNYLELKNPIRLKRMKKPRK